MKKLILFLLLMGFFSSPSSIVYAAEYSSSATIELLNLVYREDPPTLEKYRNIIAKNPNTKTAFREAIDRSSLATINLFLTEDKSLAKNELYSEDPPLERALKRGDPEIIAALINAGASVTERLYVHDGNFSFLHRAVIDGKTRTQKEADEIVCLLVKSGARINDRTRTNETPLVYAFKKCKYHYARSLISYKDIDVYSYLPDLEQAANNDSTGELREILNDYKLKKTNP